MALQLSSTPGTKNGRRDESKREIQLRRSSQEPVGKRLPGKGQEESSSLPPDPTPDSRHVRVLDLMLSRHKLVFGLGIMSGTSLNDIRIFLGAFQDTDANRVKVTKVWSKSYAIPANVKRRARRLQHSNVPQIPRKVLQERAELAKAMNVLFGKAVNAFLVEVEERYGITRDMVHFVGSAGQTFRYDPESSQLRLRTDWIDETISIRSIDTLADPAEIRDLTALPVVGMIRESDMTTRVGGRGAPLSALDDFLRFSHPNRNRIVLNIGGIANFSYLRVGGNIRSVLSCDTGPGNMVMDTLARIHGGMECDLDGAIAAKGKVVKGLLRECMQHPHFRRKPPMTTGAEEFGEHFVRETFLSKKYRDLPAEDLMRTALELTVRGIVWALRFIEGSVQEIIVYGGGAQNPVLMARLQEAVAAALPHRPGSPVFIPLAEADTESAIGPDDKEAATIALIAYKRFKGQVTNTPATGGGAAVLGGIWS